jgi:hypothetical protein
MSTLLSLDLNSALRLAVEQSMPRFRGDPLLNSLQAANKFAVTPNKSSVGPSSDTDTETHKDKVEIGGMDMASIVSGGLLSTDVETANSDIVYTAQAQMVGNSYLHARSTFTIIA